MKKPRIRRDRSSWVVTAVLGGAGLMGSGCLSPPPCPESAPAHGATCFRPEPDSCSYPGQDAVCVDGRWVINHWPVNPPSPQTCPPEAPADQGACRTHGVTCSYGSCYGTPTIQAECNGAQWEVSVRSCNPPPPARDGGTDVK
jgi:hypothetical protein